MRPREVATMKLLPTHIVCARHLQKTPGQAPSSASQSCLLLSGASATQGALNMSHMSCLNLL